MTAPASKLDRSMAHQLIWREIADIGTDRSASRVCGVWTALTRDERSGTGVPAALASAVGWGTGVPWHTAQGARRKSQSLALVSGTTAPGTSV